jgi:hypothetical protein
VRVVNGPLPTDEEGRKIIAGVSWFPDPASDSRVYANTLVNGARPRAGPNAASAKQIVMARANRVLERNQKLFRDLA